MVRVPCCEKMGLKKGPWTPEEDQILVSYIESYGHSNWRALPKQAGLLRCGKSCRLRWINYLRPDIKRGNFSNEEEETIIKLHQALGNRWSAIAAKLPGRTDNEIKNYWHTHIKKKLQGPSTSKRVMFDSARLSHPINFSYTHQRKDHLPDHPHREHAVPVFQQDPSQELLLNSTETANEAAIHGFSATNHMEFWYDLFMKAGN